MKNSLKDFVIEIQIQNEIDVMRLTGIDFIDGAVKILNKNTVKELTGKDISLQHIRFGLDKLPQQIEVSIPEGTIRSEEKLLQIFSKQRHVKIQILNDEIYQLIDWKFEIIREVITQNKMFDVISSGEDLEVVLRDGIIVDENGKECTKDDLLRDHGEVLFEEGKAGNHLRAQCLSSYYMKSITCTPFVNYERLLNIWKSKDFSTVWVPRINPVPTTNVIESETT